MCTWAVMALARRAAGTIAVSCELSDESRQQRRVHATLRPMHCALPVAAEKCEVVQRLNRYGQVWAADRGAAREYSDLRRRGAWRTRRARIWRLPECPPPQPDCQKTRITIASAESPLTPTWLPTFAAFEHESECIMVLHSKSSRSGVCHDDLPPLQRSLAGH